MPFEIEAARTILKDVRPHDAADLRERITTLAVPRMSGTEGAAETEQGLRTAFEELGYETTELPFTFSNWPGRFGPTAAGLVLALTGAGAAAILRAGLPGLALAVLVAGLVLTLLPLLLLDQAIGGIPFGKVESRNLLFTRPGARPSWLVMAHRDSKSQLIPTLVRTAAVVVGVVGWIALVVLSALWYAGELYRFETATLIAGGAVVLAGIVLALAWSSNGSPGALDNASGLAALLAVAGDGPGGEGPGGTVGFLITDGEEMGLAGARAVVEALPPVQGVVNVDGLDDRGSIRVAEGHGWSRKGSAPQLSAALLTAGRVLDIEVRRQPLPRSILVDHLPLAAAGIPALTVLRGEWRSLLRVHRPSDSMDNLDGRGAAEAATVLTAALRLLRGDARGDLAGERAAGS